MLSVGTTQRWAFDWSAGSASTPNVTAGLPKITAGHAKLTSRLKISLKRKPYEYQVFKAYTLSYFLSCGNFGCPAVFRQTGCAYDMISSSSSWLNHVSLSKTSLYRIPYVRCYIHGWCGGFGWRGGLGGAVAVWVASRPEACRLSQLQGCGFESAPLTSVA